MNIITNLTYDESLEGQRYIFDFCLHHAMFFAQIDVKHFSINTPENSFNPRFVLSKISLFGEYEKQIQLFYRTPELSCDCSHVNIYSYNINFHKLPPDINKLIQEYL